MNYVDDVLARVHPETKNGGISGLSEVRFRRTENTDEVEITGWRFGWAGEPAKYSVTQVSRGIGKTIDQAWRDMTCPECDAIVWSTDLHVKGHCSCQERGQ